MSIVCRNTISLSSLCMSVYHTVCSYLQTLLGWFKEFSDQQRNLLLSRLLVSFRIEPSKTKLI